MKTFGTMLLKNAKLWAFLGLSLVACAASESDNSDSSNQDLGIPNIALRDGNIDSAAIVESGTMMLASGPIDLSLDHYNAEDPFAINGAPYTDQLTKRFAQFDAIDGKTDWTPEQRQAWIARMTSGNYQIIDTSKPCDWENPHTYLEIERAQLTGQEHQTCGGRMPNEDTFDVNLNFLVRGPQASAQDADAVNDGVDKPTQWSSATFPYLAELN